MQPSLAFTVWDSWKIKSKAIEMHNLGYGILKLYPETFIADENAPINPKFQQIY